MTTLTLIGEAFPDLESRTHAAAARALAEAVALAAPRGCASRLLIARDSAVPTLDSPRASVESLPMNADTLPVLWRSGLSARPLDGEFAHANTPLMPLRGRIEDDGSQTSVVVPHTLAWDAPDLMGGDSVAKKFRSFTKRAMKYADVVLAPTHAVAGRLQERYGTEVQVLPLAAPPEYLAAADSASVRETLGLPERYIATTAQPTENGRLEWLLNAMQSNPELPALVVLHFGKTPLAPVRDSLAGRVHVVQVEELREVGAVLSNALLLALPQTMVGAGFEVLSAIASRVPVVYAGCESVAELAFEAAVDAPSEEAFAEALARLTSEAGAEQHAQLRLFADDRGPLFDWQSTAWRLWELHANL